MDLRDLIVTPFVLFVVLVAAYFVRAKVTDQLTRRYFMPALVLKIVGAISLGLLYTFYYDGGDTFKYHTYGSRQIWNAIIDSPYDGFDLLFSTELKGNFYKYTNTLTIYRDKPSFFVARIAAIFDLFTFSSYMGTAVLFAVTSFSGIWMLFTTFYQRYPHLHRWLALGVLFIPSIVFWGSGILKDSLTIACVGMVTFAVNRLFIQRKLSVSSVLLFAVPFFVIFSIKKYVLLCLTPALVVWVVAYSLYQMRSKMFKILLLPGISIFALAFSYYAVSKISEEDEKYALSEIAKTSAVTAHDIRYFTGKDAGSGYDLGTLDGTFSGMLQLLPQAINVSLFRPYLWEVKNPLMLLSALESLVLIILTLKILFRSKLNFFAAVRNPDVLFSMIFSLSFAFAVGISTYNFGTLVRYKIPLLPFYVIMLVLIWDYSKKERKLEVFEETE
jgi:hypothetical protein